MKSGLKGVFLGTDIYIRERVSFVRHTEENLVGLLSLQWVSASLLSRLTILSFRPWLTRDYQLTYLVRTLKIILGLSIASCNSHGSAIRIQ